MTGLEGFNLERIEGILTAHSKELSLSTMEEAFLHTIYGYNQSSYIKLSEKNKKWLEALVQPDCIKWGLSNLVFHGANIIQADIPDNQIDFYWSEAKFDQIFANSNIKQPVLRLIIESPDAN